MDQRMRTRTAMVLGIQLSASETKAQQNGHCSHLHSRPRTVGPEVAVAAARVLGERALQGGMGRLGTTVSLFYSLFSLGANKVQKL